MAKYFPKFVGLAKDEDWNLSTNLGKYLAIIYSSTEVIFYGENEEHQKRGS